MTEQCTHKNMRKIVHIIADVPAECTKLDKAAIRSQNVKIIGVDWDKFTDHWCGDCGFMQFTEPSFIQQVQAAVVSNKEYSSLALRRTKAVMALLNCRVFQAHRLVMLLWESTGIGLGHRGAGAVKPQYEHLTIDQAQELLWLVQ